MDASERHRRASEEAALWWVRFRAGELERAEREEFVDWLRESALHVAAMLRIAKVNDSLAQFEGWLQVNTDSPDDDPNIIELPAPGEPLSELGPPTSSRRRPRTGFIGAGAALLMLVAAGLIIGGHAQLIETDRGERREVALSDGSVLDVDPETRIRVAFEEHTRRVILERGRALFRVAKNPARPFFVQADGTTVRAVGTAFGVERQPRGVIVTVAEGKVRVYSSNASGRQEKPSAQPPGQSPGASRLPTPQGNAPALPEILLTAGQQVRVESGSAKPVRTVDSGRELAWAKGQLVFDNRTVAEAVDQFNRYNRIQLRVADPGLATRTVSAIFDASDPESFIAFLQTERTVTVERIDSEIVLR